MADMPDIPNAGTDLIMQDKGEGPSDVARLAQLFAIPVAQRRNVEKFRTNMEALIRRDPSKYRYAWTVKNRDGTAALVEGPTIEMAMDALREWGNVFGGALETRETPSHWIISAIFFDRETGMMTARDFAQRKSQSLGGRMDRARQEDIVFQIAQSKAIRNVVVNGLRGWMSHFLTICKDGAQEWVKANKDRCEKILADCVARHNVDLKDIERRVGKPKAKWTVPDWTQVISEMRSIEDGMISAEELYKGTEPGETVEGEGAEVEDEDEGTADGAEEAETETESAGAPEPDPEPAKKPAQTGRKGGARTKAEPEPDPEPEAEAEEEGAPDPEADAESEEETTEPESDEDPAEAEAEPGDQDEWDFTS